MDSRDSIDRLVEIESQAADILKTAEDTSSSIVLKAKAEIESAKNTKLSEERKKYESDFVLFIKSLNERIEREILNYKTSLESIVLQPEALAKKVQDFLLSNVHE